MNAQGFVDVSCGKKQYRLTCNAHLFHETTIKDMCTIYSGPASIYMPCLYECRFSTCCAAKKMKMWHSCQYCAAWDMLILPILQHVSFLATTLYV